MKDSELREYQGALKLAREAEAAGDQDEAVRQYRCAVEFQDHDMHAWDRIAYLEWARGNQPEAETAYLFIARYHLNKGQTRRAIEAYKTVLVLMAHGQPQTAAAYVLLAQAYQLQGWRTREAQALLEASVIYQALAGDLVQRARGVLCHIGDSREQRDTAT